MSLVSRQKAIDEKREELKYTRMKCLNSSTTNFSQNLAHAEMQPETAELQKWDDTALDEASNTRHGAWECVYLDISALLMTMHLHNQRRKILSSIYRITRITPKDSII